jgi:DNA-binding CsgD family transcriptional regulator
MALDVYTEKLLRELIEKVEILTKVVGIQVAADKSITERARVLKLAGLDNQSIANVLNTSPATIRTLTSNLRRPR